MTIHALTTHQGTAAAETALCERHLADPAKQSTARRAADSDVAADAEFVNCSGNETLACRVCGAQS